MKKKAYFQHQLRVTFRSLKKLESVSKYKLDFCLLSPKTILESCDENLAEKVPRFIFTMMNSIWNNQIQILLLFIG